MLLEIRKGYNIHQSYLDCVFCVSLPDVQRALRQGLQIAGYKEIIEGSTRDGCWSFDNGFSSFTPYYLSDLSHSKEACNSCFIP
jgi:hypothetical protein